MKSASKMCLCLAALLLVQLAFAQMKNNHSVKIKKMNRNVNKEAIRNLYENILNNRKLELLDSLISKDYSTGKGEKGVEGFAKSVIALINAFPDAKWTLTEIVAEGNKVFVQQRMEGTHKEPFQNIAPTNKFVTIEGTGLYEFNDGKIIYSQIQTNRLGFLQQLGVIQPDFSIPAQADTDNVFFVDKFSMPKNSFAEFSYRMEYNRKFIKHITGFIKDEIMVREDPTGNITVMTIAVWKNKGCLDIAKKLVQEEYARINFDPGSFYQQLNISMERQIFSAY